MMKKIWMILILMLCSSFILHSQYCHVGDVIYDNNGNPQGVVFYINPEGTAGWMVALTDASAS